MPGKSIESFAPLAAERPSVSGIDLASRQMVRLRISLSAANEELVRLTNRGYQEVKRPECASGTMRDMVLPSIFPGGKR